MFGYSINDFKIKDISDTFKEGIIKQYNHSNEWYILTCIFLRIKKNNIPIPIQKIIFSYWNDLCICRV